MHAGLDPEAAWYTNADHGVFQRCSRDSDMVLLVTPCAPTSYRSATRSVLISGNGWVREYFLLTVKNDMHVGSLCGLTG
jgi:hypothetical protein